jgi:fructose-1,6-bisphosphatase/sedoheptulose 1,7-bisphosphatase-like protein
MPAKDGDKERLAKAGFRDLDKVFQLEDLAPSDDVVLCATGVTDGALLRGVRFFGGGYRTQSLVVRSSEPREARFVDQILMEPGYRGPIRTY